MNAAHLQQWSTNLVSGFIILLYLPCLVLFFFNPHHHKARSHAHCHLLRQGTPPTNQITAWYGLGKSKKKVSFGLKGPNYQQVFETMSFKDHPDCCQHQVQNPACVMARGRVTARDMQGNLHICDGAADAHRHIQLSEQHTLPSRRWLFPCLFQQDHVTEFPLNFHHLLACLPELCENERWCNRRANMRAHKPTGFILWRISSLGGSQERTNEGKTKAVLTYLLT